MLEVGSLVHHHLTLARSDVAAFGQSFTRGVLSTPHGKIFKPLVAYLRAAAFMAGVLGVAHIEHLLMRSLCTTCASFNG